MNHKDEYKIICQKYPIPLFSQYWWLDAVCKNKWDVYIIKEGEALLGTFVYFLKESETGRIITKSLLTQNSGIWFNYISDKVHKKLSLEEKVINIVIDFIEGLDLCKYEQQYHYSLTSWLPFFWRGYSEITRYTFVIENTKNLNLVWENFSNTVRQNVRKAQKIVQVKENLSIDIFYEVNKMTFDRQNKPMPFSFEQFKKIHQACKENNAYKMLFAVDLEDQVHAVVYFVEDSTSIYFILGGSNPDLRNSQAYSLLIYEGIKYASSKGKKFDFEGSVIKGISNSYRLYSGTPLPYFRIYKQFKGENCEENT